MNVLARQQSAFRLTIRPSGLNQEAKPRFLRLKQAFLENRTAKIKGQKTTAMPWMVKSLKIGFFKGLINLNPYKSDI